MPKINEPIAEVVWNLKYRYQHSGQPIDLTIEDTWRRVAAAISQAENESVRAKWQAKFYGILKDYRFLPGGRILAGAGTSNQVTLFNCFVMNIEEDSMTGIFKALEEGAITLQQGGGVGYDFSVLRPHGDLAKKTGNPASGPVSFMKIWDATCSVLLSTGARRGAMMAVLRCDHPDIEEFIAAKSDPTLLRHFNVSVMVSDRFMTAVKEDRDWELIFPTDDHDAEIIYRQLKKNAKPIACRVYRRVKARELWQKIIRAAYDYAEPGVLFGDTINRQNTLWYAEDIHATNPCGEIPLPAYGACNLGAINLTQFVSEPFTANAKIDWDGIQETTQIATRFLDDVIDVSQYPLPSQAHQATHTRRIGLGITGLADLFVMLNIQYGSDESIQLTREIMKKLRDVTWQTSIELAKEKGAFPLFQPDYLHGEFVQSLDAAMQRELAKHGVRNSHHNTIAPAGTISLLANNVSNGIEPIFKADYNRHMRLTENDRQTFHVKDYAYHLWQHQQQENFPPAWIDTETLSPIAHLEIQGAAQPFIDNAISKTINIPENYPFEKLLDIYSKAYELGLKGCTIFRPNPITGNVLEVREMETIKIKEQCCERD